MKVTGSYWQAFLVSAIERVRHMYAQMYIYIQTDMLAGRQIFLVKTDERLTERDR
jgi:hypothetical protein